MAESLKPSPRNRRRFFFGYQQALIFCDECLPLPSVLRNGVYKRHKAKIGGKGC